MADMVHYRKGYCGEMECYWENKTNVMPLIQFPKDWWVRIVPPFGAAFIRFYVYGKKDSKSCVSVYLDIEDNLGCVREPYWEVYSGDEPERCLLNETDELLKLIAKGLKQNEENNP